VLGECEDLDKIVGGEVRTQHQWAREVELPGSDGIEQRGEAAYEASRADAAKGFVFGKAEFVVAVSVEARAGTSAVNTARFDLREVREQARQKLIRATDEPACGGQ
jgi:hypothetical protein